MGLPVLNKELTTSYFTSLILSELIQMSRLIFTSSFNQGEETKVKLSYENRERKLEYDSENRLKNDVIRYLKNGLKTGLNNYKDTYFRYFCLKVYLEN